MWLFGRTSAHTLGNILLLRICSALKAKRARSLVKEEIERSLREIDEVISAQASVKMENKKDMEKLKGAQ